MTRDEILKLEAGRELDALVAEKVMGYPKEIISINGSVKSPNGDWMVREIDEYSTDISAAWEVAEKLGSFWIDHTVSDLGIDVEFFTSLDHSKERLVATADTAPLAICRAALLAVMEDENV